MRIQCLLRRALLGCAILAALPPAEAAPTLRLSDGTTTVTVVDNGPGDLVAIPGYVVYMGPVGPNWVVNVSTGITKPIQGSATQPYMDLNTKNQSTGAGTLTVEFSDDSFGPVDGDMFALVGGELNTAGATTLAYSSYISNTNTLLTGDPLSATLTFSAGGPYSGTTSLPLARPANFSLTQKVVIQHGSGGFSSADAVLQLIPRMQSPMGSIGNFVWKDLNGNGIQETGEPGIDDVLVTLTREDVVIRTTTTAGGGYYDFPGLTAGDYIVTVIIGGTPADGLLPSPTGAGTPASDSNASPVAVTLADNEQNQTIDFGFYEYVPPTGKIGDFVWKDTNQNGIQETGEPGIGGVTVYLKNLGTGGISQTTTASNGSYLFTGLKMGSYEVQVDTSSPALVGFMPTFANEPGSTLANDSNVNPSPVSLETDHSVDLTIDFGYFPVPGGTIGDYVWRDLNGDGIQGDSVNEPGIAGVTVELLNSSSALIKTTTTDADGYYLFTGLSKGTYYVRVAGSLILEGFTYTLTTANAPGSTIANDSNPTPTQVILANNSSSDLNSDFGYTPVPAGKIGDFVWNDLNGNGIQDASEPGIGNVTVQLLSLSNVVLATTTTAGNGSYLFSGLSAGTYQVNVVLSSASLNGFLPTPVAAAGSTTGNDSNPNPSTVELLSNTSSDLTQDFGFIKPCGTIGNFVWKDLNQNGIQDSGEAGIGGVTVQLYNASNVLLASQNTTSGGAYLFTGLTSGTYIVAVNNASPALSGLMATDSNAPGSTLLNDSNANPETVVLPTHNSSDLTIDFGYIPVPVGSIGDFVWKDVNGNGIQDSGEPGIAGVSVTLYKGSNPNPLGTAVTDANGLYLFTGLSSGTYSVVVNLSSPSLAGYTASPVNASGSTAANDSNPNPAPVSLATNTSIDRTIDFGFVPPPTGKIGDYVWNDLNRNGIQEAAEPGIGGVTVKLYNAATNTLLATTVTSSSGAYLFSGLTAGNYKVVVDAASAALVGFVATPTTAAGSTLANDSNGSPATVSLATNYASNLTIDFGYNRPPPKCFTTYTMGGWGAEPSGSNPGTLLLQKFTQVYPTGLLIGGKYTIKFTSQLGIQNFLPTGSTPRGLTKSYINPTTDLGTLAGQVNALRLNVDFSNAGILPTGLKAAVFKTGPFAGKTVGYVLSFAESILGGGSLPKGMSYSTIADACGLVNENYNEGINSGFMTP
jgi:hypothetical protein